MQMLNAPEAHKQVQHDANVKIMQNYSKKILVLSVLSVWFVLPVMVLAQDLPAPDLPPSGGAPDVRPPAVKNAAENINVELKIPLPFVPLRCFATDAAGKKLNPPVAAVCSLSDYLEGVYRLLVGAGALLAVVMIIIAGYQWMIAGGSADKAGAAKKRVWGATMGLALALVSYIVLNAISSRLVDLRLPQIKPIQPFTALVDGFCQSPSEPPDKINPLIKLSADSGDKDDFLVDANNTDADGRYFTSSLQNAECGHKYYVGKDQKLGQCMGGKCCGDESPDSPCNNVCIAGQCVSALVYGKVNWNKVQTPPFRDYLTGVEVYQLCDGLAWINMNKVAENYFSGRPDAYRVPRAIYTSITEKCPIGETYLGYALGVYVNDGFLGQDNFFVAGNDCKAFAAGGFIGDLGLRKLQKNIVTNTQLITAGQLNRGFKCTLDLTDKSFADY